MNLDLFDSDSFSDSIECPICYESPDTGLSEPCTECHQRICHRCTSTIRRSTTVVTACPFCRTPIAAAMQSLQSSETLAEWRRRLRLTRQLTQWAAPVLTVANQDPFQPDSTAGIVAAAQVILMGVWFWAHV
jgi:hypothetical protein